MALSESEDSELRRRIDAAVWQELDPFETLIEGTESLPFDRLWPILQGC